MSDAAPPFETASLVGQSANGALTPERIERALADFRNWLTDPPPGDVVHAPEREPIDLHTLVGQFIALRHEVNLQTKAARASLEQNAETLQRLDAVIEDLQKPAESDTNTDAMRPLLKALVDVNDALALSSQQVERQKSGIQAGLQAVLQTPAIEPLPAIANLATPRRTLWARLFGAPSSGSIEQALEHWRERILLQARERGEKTRAAIELLNQSLEGLITGYSMSLNRVDRVLMQFGLERIACEGQRFDPETMEVVEVVTGGDRNAGEVVAEARRGYLLNGAVFRYAQVRVAK